MKISKKYALSALAISASCMLSTFTQAASNTITFNGTVSDTTCTATIDGGVTSIEMGTTSVADLKANTFGAAKNFSFSLANCPTTEEGATLSPASPSVARQMLRTVITSKTRPRVLLLPALRSPFLITRVIY